LITASHSIKVEGVRETLQLLDAVQPGAIKELRKDIKTIITPSLTAIKSRVPSTAPLSGMSHYGRTRYAGPKVTSKLLLGASRYKDTTPLIRIEVVADKDSAGFEIADMAGRKTMAQGPQLQYSYTGKGRVGGSGRQSPTKSRPVVRRGNSREFSYTINRSPKRTFMQSLGGTPSRYVYPPVENNLSKIAADMLKTLEAYAARINQKIKVS
jgi:hypothetical protein